MPDKSQDVLVEGFEKKGGVKSVLYLILLHRPDYGYHIATMFKNLMESDRWDVKDTKILAIPSKVTSLLKEMEEENLIKPSKRVIISGKERKYYEASLDILGLEFSNEFAKLFDELMNVYKKSKLPNDVWIDPISQLKKFDYITILGFIQRMIRAGGIITSTLLFLNNAFEPLFSLIPEGDEEMKDFFSHFMFTMVRLPIVLTSKSSEIKEGDVVESFELLLDKSSSFESDVNVNMSIEAIGGMLPHLKHIEEIIASISSQKHDGGTVYGSLLREAENVEEVLKDLWTKNEKTKNLPEEIKEKVNHEIYRSSVFHKMNEFLEDTITQRINFYSLIERGFMFPSFESQVLS